MQCDKMKIKTWPKLKTDSTQIIDSKAQEHVLEMYAMHGHGGREGHKEGGECPFRAVVCTPLFMVLCSTMFVIFCGGLLLAGTPDTGPVHYRRYCTIPLKLDAEELASELMPVHWSQKEEADAKVYRFGHVNGLYEPFEMRALREEFDVGDQVERIFVEDDGKRVTFIHDFEQNTTDIEDTERCFTTELDRRSVLPPSLLLMYIEDGAVFDTTSFRAALRAQLPALAPGAVPPALRDACAGKPVYRLLRHGTDMIRKRSVDVPAHDYIQFSGCGIQEIEISNLADILQHEQDAANVNR